MAERFDCMRHSLLGSVERNQPRTDIVSEGGAEDHWHGLTQRTAPFSDGAPQVSQWPIPPGHFFDYEIHPDVGDAGTYFYHSHVGFQAITATGALIVRDRRRPPYKYDGDRILQLGDYYNKTDDTIVDGLLANPFVWSGETIALLLNGKSGTKAGNATTKRSSCAPAIIKVQPGKSYRFRFIGHTAISLVTLGIEDHPNMTIIEADGRYTQPYATSHLQIASGQRFSTLFKAKSLAEILSSNKRSYWIQFENRERPNNVTGYALLVYDLPAHGIYYNLPGNYTKRSRNNRFTLPATLPSPPPLSLPFNVTDWAEQALQPLQSRYTESFPPLSAVTRTVFITVKQVSAGKLEWSQNDVVWQPSLIPNPYLTEIYLKGEAAIPDFAAAAASGGVDPVSRTFPARIGEVLDIVWLNNNGPSGGWDFHPFHAHGGHYWDLGAGNGTYDAAANDARMKANNYTPVLRDTTVGYRYATKGVPQTTAGWRAWRVHVKEPGVWMLHCHILQHMVMGMQTVWVFGNASEIVGRAPAPYVAGYLEFGGSAYGNASYDPLPPDELVSNFILLGISIRIQPCRERIVHFLSAEADDGLRAEILVKHIIPQYVVLRILRPIQLAVLTSAVNHAQAQPGNHLANVLHDGERVDLELPLEAFLDSLREVDVLAKRDERVHPDALVAGPAFPQMREEVMPGFDERAALAGRDEVADPVGDVALAPSWHGGEAGVPVRPDVLLRGDRVMHGERGEDLFVGARVKWLDEAELRGKFLWDWKFG
ncbi:Laccase-4 [Drechslerella dactyloides]|uniref:Laccase-4 n=1 Tax=Drechslerella dactyloides TaxID=74499 RepID=A0AAD6IWI6_DREDA|nr:Laccase-4 [Drechslerella dactyloides]